MKRLDVSLTVFAVLLVGAACSSSKSTHGNATDGGTESGGASSGGAGNGGASSGGSGGTKPATGGTGGGGTGSIDAGSDSGSDSGDARAPVTFECLGAPPADAGAGPRQDAGPRSDTCVVGESYCHVQLSNLQGDRGGTYGSCVDVKTVKPDCISHQTCDCIVPHPDAVCSCVEKNGQVTVTCGPV